MLDELAHITAELRRLGIAVSLQQQVVAAKALQSVDPLSRDEVFGALECSLINRDVHLPALRTILDIYLFSRNDTRQPMAELDDEGLLDLLPVALRNFDKRTLELISREAVLRHGGFRPGRAVGGSYYVTRAMRWLKLDDAEAAIASDTDGAERVVAMALRKEREQFVREAVDSTVRSLIVQDRGAAELSRLRRAPLVEDIEFLHASSDQLRQLERAIEPAARRLANRLRLKTRRRSGVDMRRTIRKALAKGGVVSDLVPDLEHAKTPPLVVLADVSGSVASFASFTFSFMRLLSHTFSRARFFAFIDEIADVTKNIAASSDARQLSAALNADGRLVRGDGRSDYGHCLKAIRDRWADQLTDRTIVLILGDGRNNNRAPREEALAEISRSVRSVFWLNPEGRENWTHGDSAIERYRPHCNLIVECRTLGQLQRFIATL